LLFRACECGDLAEVKRIIEANQKEGPDWNTVEHGFSRSEIVGLPSQSLTGDAGGASEVTEEPSIKWLVDA